MKTKKKGIYLLAILASWAFLGLAHCWAAGPTKIPAYTYINSPTTWTKENSPYLIGGPVYVEAELTIEPGVVVKFDYTPSYHAGRLEIYNKFTAIGTEDEKIIFTSGRDDSFGGDTNKDGNASQAAPGDWWHINFCKPEYPAKMENVSVFYGGGTPGYFDGAILVNNTDNVSVEKTEIKYCSNYGIQIINSQPTIEGNIIANNNVGVQSTGDKTPVISNNFIVNNKTGALVDSPLRYKLDARNNWWGSRTGPYYKSRYGWPDNQGGKGNPISDGVYFDPWLRKDPSHVREPLILIPGIGGTVNWDLMISGVLSNNWRLMSHTYDGILEAFRNMGYEEGKDLFICYYDWRQKNADSARDFLKPLISKANILNGTTKVNIVAHSMGGILARSYIQSDSYVNDVDNLIMIGTPNKGASDVYPVWEGGYIPKNWESRLIFLAYLDYLRVKNITPSAYQSIHQYIPSVKELMPLYDYIHPKDNPQNLKSYLAMTEVNDWLKNLNDNIELLHQRVKVSIISGNGQPTVNTIPVIETDDNTLWLDGKPDPIDPEKNDRRGDKRVLLSSSQIGDLFDSKILDFDHGKIVDQSAQIIASKLNEEVDKIFDSPSIDNELAFWFASPVEVEIKSPDEKIITKETNNIPLAMYSGESRPDGFKFISIPNPVKGEYEIKLTGIGEGNFHVGSIYVDYRSDVPNKESVVESTIAEGQEKKYKIEYDPQNVENPVSDIKPLDTTSPTITFISPQEGEKYLNNQTIPVNYQITDDVSLPDEITKTVEYDDQPFSANEIDLSLEHLGEHVLKINAQDKAGNSASKETKFQITTNLEALQNNLWHYFELGLIKEKIAYKYFYENLKMLEKIFDLLEKTKNSKLETKLKQVAVATLEKAINTDIDQLIKQINRKSPQWIEPKAAELLTEGLKAIRIE